MSRRPSILLAMVLLAGCLDFGPKVTTSTPSAKDVARCRAEMYLRSDIEIEPQGFQLVSGIDASIWFKFIARTEKIAAVFNEKHVDTSQFSEGYKSHSDSSLPAWWDAADKKLTGGQVELPNGRFMDVGFSKNEDRTLTVYVMWFET